jgi:hypothetical protein
VGNDGRAIKRLIMLGWLRVKGENSRVFACVKDVKWFLENADETRRAVILALAHFLRMGLVDAEPAIQRFLDRPFDYERVLLMKVYGILEHSRNLSMGQSETTKRNYVAMRQKAASLGLSFEGPSELPQFAIQHFKNTQRGMEIWMCTLGAGIAPDRRGDVQLIWSYLMKSMRSLPIAIEELRSVERRTAEMTGVPDGQLFSINSKEWLELCRFVPSPFVGGR